MNKRRKSWNNYKCEVSKTYFQMRKRRAKLLPSKWNDSETRATISAHRAGLASSTHASLVARAG